MVLKANFLNSKYNQMKQFLLILFLALGLQTQAQTITYVPFPGVGTFTVTTWPYPGSVTVVPDGDLVRVKLSSPLPGYTMMAKYQDQYINQWSGLPETSTGDLHVSANLLSTNAGVAPHTQTEIKVPMQLVTTEGNFVVYLASIKNDTLFQNGRKTGFSSTWSIKVRWALIDEPNLTGTVYETPWVPVNIASLPAMPSTTFYSGVVLNPEQPAYVKPGKGKGARK